MKMRKKSDNRWNVIKDILTLSIGLTMAAVAIHTLERQQQMKNEIMLGGILQGYDVGELNEFIKTVNLLEID